MTESDHDVTPPPHSHNSWSYESPIDRSHRRANGKDRQKRKGRTYNTMHDDANRDAARTRAALKEPFLGTKPPRSASTRMAGMLMVTAAALLFGVVAAFVKATALPTLVMVQARSLLEWIIGLIAAITYLRTGGRDMVPLPQAEITQAAEKTKAASDFLPSPPPSATIPRANILPQRWNGEPEDAADAERPSVWDGLTLVLVGPPHLRLWVVLRAFLYWGFLACWWLALTAMPIGDATTIVYTAPIWTATFARVLLGERIDWSFYPIVALDAVGLVLITQPSYLGFHNQPSGPSQEGAMYMVGALSSLTSAVIAGLLPICTRKSKACVWTAVNHTSSFLSAFAFTPLAFLVWTSVDDTAWQQSIDALARLESRADGGMGKWPLLIGATLTGFAGLALQTLGYQREEAAKASVMTILEIPFAYLLQFFAFGDELNAVGIGGVALVCCATMLNLIRHVYRAKRKAPGS